MSSLPITIETWAPPEAEEEMAAGHVPAWNGIIKSISETDLSQKTVLDFGCNRGGFLRVLNEKKPFLEGLGVDIAVDSLNKATLNKGNMPIEYKHVSELKNIENKFDIVFSHEVVYLLPDLLEHTKEIKRVLRENGVYYLVLGEHSDNPLWSRWEKQVKKFSVVKPYTYSLDQISSIFRNEGFKISLRRLSYDGFFSWEGPNKYIHSPDELLNFMYKDMVMFKLLKTSNV